MFEVRRTRLFLIVLVTFHLQYSNEYYQPEINSLNESDLGPAYNIIQNPEKNIELNFSFLNHTKSFSSSNESNKANPVKENDNESKDKAPFEVKSGRELFVKSTMLLNEQNKNFSLNVSELIEENDMTKTENQAEVQEKENLNSDEKEAETSNEEDESRKHIDVFDENFANISENEMSIPDSDNLSSNDVADIIPEDGLILIRPRTISVEENMIYPGDDDEIKASRSANSIEDKRSNHRRWRRTAVPKDIAFDYSGEDEHMEVSVRDIPGCKIPSFMRHSELRCKTYQKKVVCRQRCVWGYRLKNGKTKRSQKCRRRRGWSPSKSFSDCLPHAKCNITLVSGSKKCIYNYMDEAPHCDISCKIGKRTKTYACSEIGEWSPKLPKCAKGQTPECKGCHASDIGHKHHHHFSSKGKSKYSSRKQSKYSSRRESKKSSWSKSSKPKLGKAFVMKELDGKTEDTDNS